MLNLYHNEKNVFVAQFEHDNDVYQISIQSQLDLITVDLDFVFNRHYSVNSVSVYVDTLCTRDIPTENFDIQKHISSGKLQDTMTKVIRNASYDYNLYFESKIFTIYINNFINFILDELNK